MVSLMSFSGRVAMVLVSVAFCGAVGTSSAFAQTCGDADGSGSVTVTDGVQVLRSAAGLSSSCSEHANSCDVDGSGSATITDGVNVLRKAAGITITENCPGGGDGTADVAEVTDVLVPFLTFGLREVPSVSATGTSVQPAGGTEDCEDGGSRTTNQSGATVTVTFDACKVSEAGLGSFQLDGVIQAQLGLPSTLTFDLKVTNLGSSELVDFHGSIQGQPRLGGGFVVDGGPISVLGPNEGPEIFRLTFNDLTVDGDGHIESGSVEAEDTSDSFELETVEVEVEDGSSTASVHVVRDDDTEQDYTLNLETGDLTPVN
jgi:hypothetical protein